MLLSALKTRKKVKAIIEKLVLEFKEILEFPKLEEPKTPPSVFQIQYADFLYKETMLRILNYFKKLSLEEKIAIEEYLERKNSEFLKQYKSLDNITNLESLKKLLFDLGLKDFHGKILDYCFKKSL